MKCNRGFTLIELLIAVALFSVVATSVYFNFHTGLTVYSRVEKSLGAINGYRLSFDRLEMDLHNIVKSDENAFKGKNENIIFPAFIEMYKKGKRVKDFFEITYLVENKILYRVIKPLRKERLDSKTEYKQAFLWDVHNGGFEYAYLTPDYDVVWKDTWENVESDNQTFNIPYGVRLRFTPYVDGKDEARASEGRSISKICILPLGNLAEVKLNE
ncbi:type II secretion system protein J [Candidatus Omnitrophota bacterium]